MNPAHDYRKALARLPALGSLLGGANHTTPTVHIFSIVSEAHWFLTDYDPEQELAFGLCDLGLGFPELGYVAVEQFEAARKGALPLIEVDLHWSGTLADGYKRIGREVPSWL